MLIGFDNGNPRDHDPMKSNQRKTFNGLALAVVQSTGKAGSIRIKATSKGLKEGTENIITFLTAGTAVTL
jgi:beta-galactosidase